MSKDPAFLFYPNDYIGGTMGMTFEEKGAYMELLMMQFNRGHMTTHMIGQVVGQLWVNIQHKFKQDENGLWYNERLEIEKNKRKAFTDSRRKNLKGINQYTKKEGHKGGHMTNHMENENENENINKDKIKILYDTEIKNSNNRMYYDFVKFMFGDNDLKEPLRKCLQMKDQITFEKYEKLMKVAQHTGVSLRETILNLERHPKKYISLYLTLNNWLK